MRQNKASTKRLIRVLHKRLGRAPSGVPLPGISAWATWQLYMALGTICRAFGIRY